MNILSLIVMAPPPPLKCWAFCALIFAALFTPDSRAQKFNKIASWPGYTRGESRDLQVRNGKAYIAMGDGGLCIVDVSNPAQPAVMSRLDLPGRATKIKFGDDNYAYVGCGSAGLAVVNVTNPSAPVHESQFATGNELHDFAISSPQIYLAAGNSGLILIDISNPSAPRRLGSYTGKLPALDVESYSPLPNRYAYLAGGETGLHLLNVSNAANISLVESDVYAVTNLFRGPKFLYAPHEQVNETRFWAFRYANRLSIAGPPSVFSFGNVFDMSVFSPSTGGVVAGGNFYAASGFDPQTGGFFLFEPSSRFLARRVVGTGDYRYVAEFDRGLEIWQGNTLVGSVQIHGVANRLRVAGDRIYVADAEAGFHAFRFENEQSLKHLSTYSIGMQNGFDVVSSNVFLVGNTNFQIVDFTDIAKPQKIFAVKMPAIFDGHSPYGALDVALRDGKAFVSHNLGILNNSVKVFDVSDPPNTRLLGEGSGASPWRMHFDGDILFGSYYDFYSARFSPDFSTLDPVQIIPLDSRPRILNFKIAGSRAYVPVSEKGLRVYDITDPSKMTLLGEFATPSARGVEVLADTAYVADDTGVFILDVLNPASIKLIARFETANPVYDIAIRGELLFLANSVEGLTIWKMVPLLPQTINFPEITEKTTRSAPFSITATSSSGLPVTVALVSGPATFQNGTLLTTGPGVVVVRASQTGNSDYNPATVERSFTVIEVLRDPQIITVPQVTAISNVDDPFFFPISNSSGLPLQITVTGPITLANNVLTVKGLGEAKITATHAGNRDLAPASVERTFTIRDLASAATANALARNPALSEAESMPTADPDRDGLPNVVEYILRTDPASATSQEGHTTATIHESAGNRYLKAHYLKPRVSKYVANIQVTDFSLYPYHKWVTLAAGFNSDATGDFLWPLSNYKFPVVRFVIRYP